MHCKLIYVRADPKIGSKLSFQYFLIMLHHVLVLLIASNGAVPLDFNSVVDHDFRVELHSEVVVNAQAFRQNGLICAKCKAHTASKSLVHRLHGKVDI